MRGIVKFIDNSKLENKAFYPGLDQFSLQSNFTGLTKSEVTF